jgi:hypothetical protein
MGGDPAVGGGGVLRIAAAAQRNYRKYLEPHLEKLEPFVKAFGYE